jgi:hypothetical protein
MLYVKAFDGETAVELNDPHKLYSMLLTAGIEDYTLSACEAIVNEELETDEDYIFTPESFTQLFRQATPEAIAAENPELFGKYMSNGEIVDRAGLLSAIDEEFFCFNHPDSFTRALHSGNFDERIVLPDGGIVYSTVPSYLFYEVTGDPKYID